MLCVRQEAADRMNKKLDMNSFCVRHLRDKREYWEDLRMALDFKPENCMEIACLFDIKPCKLSGLLTTRWDREYNGYRMD